MRSRRRSPATPSSPPGSRAGRSARRWPSGGCRSAGALSVAGAGLAVILASEAILDPIFNGGAQQGIEPTHTPATTHQWVAVAVAAVMLVLVAPAAEELIFRGLGFAALGSVAVPVTSLLFAIAHGLPSLLVEVAVAGLVLAEIRRRTASVLPGMGVHMAFNALALVVAFVTV